MAHVSKELSSFDPAREIRVLCLEKGDFESPLCASYIICSVDRRGGSRKNNAVPWEAVSYAWEGQKPTETLLIEGKPVNVPRIVLQMLKSLRQADRKRFLWIDAICIDQQNEDEKSQQVALMAKIYQNAATGIIWLRIDGHEDLARDMVTASRWLNAVNKEELAATKGSKSALMSAFSESHPHVKFKERLTNLAKLPWFQRIWVVQEATLCKYLLVQLGDETLPWDAFASALLRFVGHGSLWRDVKLSLDQCYQECRRRDARMTPLDKETLMGLGMVNLIVSLREWQQNPDTIQVWPSGLALMCRDFLATVPSDKIYGLAGLFGLNGSPGHLAPFRVDYSLDSMEVYTQFTLWCIRQENSLDVLAQQRHIQRRHQDDRSHNLPSWMTDWTAQNLAGSTLIGSRSLLSNSESVKSSFSRQRPVCRRDDMKLMVRGYIIDTIKERVVGIKKGSEAMLKRWLAMIPDDPESNLLLFGVEKPTIETLDSLYERTSAKDSSIIQLWRENSISQGQREDMRSAFRHDMLTARGCLAFAQPSVKVEDNIKVCALRGGRGLFLLQEIGARMYKLICGDCFIDGFEDGKGIDVARQLGLPEEDICLV